MQQGEAERRVLEGRGLNKGIETRGVCSKKKIQRKDKIVQEVPFSFKTSSISCALALYH